MPHACNARSTLPAQVTLRIVQWPRDDTMHSDVNGIALHRISYGMSNDVGDPAYYNPHIDCLHSIYAQLIPVPHAVAAAPGVAGSEQDELLGSPL